MSINETKQNEQAGFIFNEIHKDGFLSKFDLNFYRTIRNLASRFFCRSETNLKPRLLNKVARAFNTYRVEAAPRDQILAGLVLIFGVLISVGGFFAVQSFFKVQAQREFDAAASRFLMTLGDSIDSNLSVLKAGDKLFRSSDEVTRWQFFDYAEEILPEHAGIRSLEWIPRVSADQRKAYEAAARKDGLFDFKIFGADARQGPATAADRNQYFPIYYLEPFQGNEGRIGLDLASQPEDLAVLERARDAGGMTSEPLRPVLANAPTGAGFVAVLPIYRGEGPPFTVEERRRKLTGYLRVVFDLGRLIESALPGLTAPPGVDIYLFDLSAAAGERLIYYHPSPLRNDTAAGPLTEQEAVRGLYSSAAHAVADRQWSIMVKPVSSYFTRNVQIASWAFCAVLLLMTASLVQYLVASQTRTRSIERSVHERTAALQAEIAERKRVEQELRSAKKQAEVANLSKSEFLAMMSHELRTPLNAVLGFAEVIAGEMIGPVGNERYRRYGEDILVSGTHLLSLINDILDLSKIEAQKYDLVEEDLDVGQIWEAVRAILQPNIATAGLDVRIELSPDLPLFRADQRAVRQILINLLSNAVKFTPKGGEIVGSSQLDDQGRFVVAVTDNGIGIAEDDLAGVLEPFKQVDSSLARKYEGTGLGLPLTKRLVEMHGGQLEIHSALGKGTQVRLTFAASRVVRAAPKAAGNEKLAVEGAA